MKAKLELHMSQDRNVYDVKTCAQEVFNLSCLVKRGFNLHQKAET